MKNSTDQPYFASAYWQTLCSSANLTLSPPSNKITRADMWGKSSAGSGPGNNASQAHHQQPSGGNAASIVNRSSQFESQGFCRARLRTPNDLVFDRIRRGMDRLVSQGWPPHFICVYDEFWLLANFIQDHVIRQSITAGTNDITSIGANALIFNMDIMAWYACSSNCAGKLPGYYDNSVGFGPRREISSLDNLAESFIGSTAFPKHVTCWIPLYHSDTNDPDSGLFLIPRNHDPGYAVGDKPNLDPIMAVLSGQSDEPSSGINFNTRRNSSHPFIDDDYSGLQKIRALTIPKGCCAFYSHRLITWTGGAYDGFTMPRAAITLNFSFDSFQEPLIREMLHPGNALPSFEQRLALAAGQSIVNMRRFRFTEREKIGFFFKIFTKFNLGFSRAYQAKVASEYKWYRKDIDVGAEFISLSNRNDDSMMENILSLGKGTDVEDDSFKDPIVSIIRNCGPKSTHTDGCGDNKPAKKQPPKNAGGFGIFKDIFKSVTSKGKLEESSIEATPSTSSSPSNCSSRIPSISSSPTNENYPIVDKKQHAGSKQKKNKQEPKECCECGNILGSESKKTSSQPESKASSAPLKSALKSDKDSKGKKQTTEKDVKMEKFQNCVDTVEAFTEFFQNKRILDDIDGIMPHLLNASTQDRAKHLYSIFFNDDGSQKITGSDLKHVVPIVCPDFSAVQRMAQGFYGNAKEFENQGQMFGSIALDLIRNVPQFHVIPADFHIIQAAARRIGVKLRDNHLKSIGQALNIFLREVCYTYLLFFRTIIPTMVTHAKSTETPSESFNQSLYSRRIQQDFETTMCILVSLMPLGPLFADPIVDVVDTLIDAAKDIASPALLLDACHLISVCAPPAEKISSWRLSMGSLIMSLPLDEIVGTYGTMLKPTLGWFTDDIDPTSTPSIFTKIPIQIDEGWQRSLDNMPFPCPSEMVDIILSQVSDDSLSYKVRHISRLEIKDIVALEKVAESVHNCALISKDATQLYSGVCLKLCYRLDDFDPEYTRRLLKKTGIKNRSKLTKREIFKKLLLRQFQKEFYRNETEEIVERMNNSNSRESDEELSELRREYYMFRRRKIRNTRLLCWLVKLSLFSPGLLVACILPTLLRMNAITDNNSTSNNSNSKKGHSVTCTSEPSEVEIDCALVTLRMTGKMIDKAYKKPMDQFFKRLRQIASMSSCSAIVRADIEYIIRKREQGWRSLDESCFSSDAEDDV